MIEEIKYCSELMKKHLNEELLRTRDNKDFKNSTKCWICNSTYVNGDVRVRHHCHNTRKYRESTHRYCNINFK